MHMIASIFLLVLMLLPGGEAFAAWDADASLSAVYDDNLNRAPDRSDRKADSAVLTRVSLGYHAQPGVSTGVTAGVEIKDTAYARFDGLDTMAASVWARLKHKLGLGSYASWLMVYGSAGYQGAREAERSGPTSQAGVTAGKRVHERLFLQAGYEYDAVRARNDLFRGRAYGPFVRADYLATETVTLSLGYAQRDRQCVSYEAADAAAVAAGEYVVNTFGTTMEPYSIDAEDHTISVGVNVSLDRHWSANAGLERHAIRTEDNLYHDFLYRADIQYSY